ncbi:MAG: ABC transporter substrate-binding protein [Clostridia bacterium]|nr:ABC transporter substrate-binding protein [Clostridia bacterium]
MKTRRIISALLALVMLMSLASFASAEEAAAYTQSPYLDGQDLPAVAERLPIASDVMVEEVADIGQYTDYITLMQGGSSKWGPGKPTEEALFRFRTDGTVEPNVAKGYEVNEDCTVWTIHLREGMKWSDGVPFTTEDCRFFYEDCLLTGFTGKSAWEAVKAADENGEMQLAKFEAVDDYTFTMTFASSKPEFLRELAINGKWFFAPKHWLEEHVAVYKDENKTAEEKDAYAQALGFSDMKALGNSYTYYYWIVVGRPTLRAWQIDGDFNAEMCVWKRNPYYWKVDAEGKQLPYIDELHFRRYSDDSQALLWIMDGTADIGSVALADVDTILASDAKVNLVEWSSTSWTSQSMQLNLAVKDDLKRPLFQNVNFRHALSILVDRAQIASLIDNGYTDPAQSAPPEGAQGYDPEWTKKWTEQNPEEAAALLEGCGLVKGADGFWAFADGTKLTLNLQYQNEADAALAELLKNDFNKAGLDVTTRMYDRSIMEEMRAANEHEIVLNYENFDTVSISLRPDYFVPLRDYCVWGTAFGLWYLNSLDGKGREGAVEPPEDVKAMLEIYTNMKNATTSEQKEELALQLLECFREGIYEIGFTSANPAVYAVNSAMHNFREDGIACDEFRDLGLANFACLWVEK